MTSIITRTAIAGLAAIAFASPSLAATAFKFDFEYDPAKVETAAGAEQVYEALTDEVTTHCRVTEHPTRWLNEVSTQRCIDRTLAKAVSQIDSPALSSVHEQAQR